MPCIWTSRTDSVVNDVRRVAHDPGALRSHDYGISGGSAIYAGLVLPSVSELGDTEETSLINGSNDRDHCHSECSEWNQVPPFGSFRSALNFDSLCIP